MQYLEDDSDEGIEIKMYFSEYLEMVDLKVHQFDVLVIKDGALWTGIEIPHEKDFILLAKLNCVVLHPWGSTYISIDKHSNTLHF